MDNLPSYNSPLQLPQLQMPAPYKFPQTPKQYQSKSTPKQKTEKEDKLPEVKGLTGQVNSWQRGVNAAKNEMLSIASDYGIGNVAYAQKYDKKYQQAASNLNTLTSVAYMNQLERAELEKDNFEEHVDTKGDEIDLEHYHRTGEVRDLNKAIDRMEYDPNFDFANFGNKPDMTTFKEARQQMVDFMNVDGFTDRKTQGKEVELASQIVDGMKKFSTMKVTGTKTKNNINETNAAMADLSSMGLGTEMMTGMMRGFIDSGQYTKMKKAYKGKGDIRQSKEYTEALQSFLEENLKFAASMNYEDSIIAGDQSLTVNYRALSDETIRNRTQASNMVGYLTGTIPNTGVQVTRQNYGMPTGVDKSQAPKGSTGHTDQYVVGMYSSFETQVATDKINKQAQGRNNDASNMNQNGYYLDPNSGQFYSAANLKGFKITKAADYLLVGNEKPAPTILNGIQWNARTSQNEQTRNYVYGQNLRPRSQAERIEYEKQEMELKAAGNFVAAQKAGNKGVGFSVTMEMPKDEFEAWKGKTYVTGTQNYNYDNRMSSDAVKAEAKKRGYTTGRHSKKGDGFEFSINPIQMEEFYQKGKGKKISYPDLVGILEAEGFFKSKTGKTADVDFTANMPLGGKGNNYTDGGIERRHSGSFEYVTNDDGIEVVRTTMVMSAGNAIFEQPGVSEEFNRKMQEYDMQRAQADKESTELLDVLPNQTN